MNSKNLLRASLLSLTIVFTIFIVIQIIGHLVAGTNPIISIISGLLFFIGLFIFNLNN